MNPKRPLYILAAFAAGLILFFVALSMSVTIEPGEKGLIFRPFSGGLDKEKIYDQGFHLVAPWNTMIVYDVKLHEDLAIMEVLSKNGLTIKLEVSYWFRPEVGSLPLLHDELGPEYLNRVVIPSVRSAAREVIGKYLPEELYSTKREVIEGEIFTRTAASVTPKHITIDKVLIRDVSLPKSLQEAIEKKLKQEQLSLEYEFRLTAARKEAERTMIEAEGKARANNIVNSSLTDRILKEKGIEATMRLAESNNAKVVVVGAGTDGLPIILGGDK
jgi:regulator of protease activity HflC (stomatin/prohibitin superfamily)